MFSNKFLSVPENPAILNTLCTSKEKIGRVNDMLSPGLYEQIINTALNRELSEISDARKSVAPIDKAEASKVLAQYLADVVQKGLENVVDNGGDISTQISLANQIVTLIQNTTQEADFAALSVDQRAEQLLALLREQDPRLAVGKTAADLSRPETSIAQSSLFTGAIHEPQMYTELKKEIVSADRIDMLVSFIKWSGLRLLMDELREFTRNGGELRIITTSYMGATDVKAIEELRALPNTLTSSSTVSVGYALAKKFFIEDFQETAMFAVCDTVALGVMAAAKEFCVSIPDDLSLLGFDNIQYSDLPNIHLTTLDHQISQVMAAALDQLLSRIGGDAPADPQPLMIPPVLCRRNSCQARA